LKVNLSRGGHHELVVRLDLESHLDAILAALGDFCDGGAILDRQDLHPSQPTDVGSHPLVRHRMKDLVPLRDHEEGVAGMDLVPVFSAVEIDQVSGGEADLMLLGICDVEIRLLVVTTNLSGAVDVAVVRGRARSLSEPAISGIGDSGAVFSSAASSWLFSSSGAGSAASPSHRWPGRFPRPRSGEAGGAAGSGIDPVRVQDVSVLVQICGQR
jgi:hypothetical protein